MDYLGGVQPHGSQFFHVGLSAKHRTPEGSSLACFLCKCQSGLIAESISLRDIPRKVPSDVAVCIQV